MFARTQTLYSRVFVVWWVGYRSNATVRAAGEASKFSRQKSVAKEDWANGVEVVVGVVAVVAVRFLVNVFILVVGHRHTLWLIIIKVGHLP